MDRNFIKKLFTVCILFISYIGFSQEYTSFTRTYPNGNQFRYQNNIKGDLTFIANNIVNRDGGTSSTEPEDPYNTTGNSSTYNDWLDQQYIDVDSDPVTFSSSSAIFNFSQASCNLIRYAGLYWSATYPSSQAGQPVGTGRQNDFNQVKLMVPGGSYVDITADEVLFDGFTNASSSVRQNSPYACYADITSLITPLANPTGTYTVANIRSVVGSLSPGGGAAGGWTLVIVYENPTLSGKLITTYDGFARVNSANPNVNINYAGFNTIPIGPVRANIGAAALEGDNRITGDRMRIRAASNGSFTTISNAVNPANNFFNSNITLNGIITTNRVPNSINTLGYDTDIFLLNNPANSVIPNAETAATFRFTSNGDQYYPFFNSFNIEIIEPNIVVEKRVEDIGGNDITGLGVNLGQELDYVLTFQNTGNDDAINYTLRDILPVNVTFIPANLVMPPGVTYSYDSIGHIITFSIPSNLVEKNDPPSEIRLRVKVAENCFDFIDACTDLIQNLAYSTYEGVINNNQITDDPSVSDFDNCGFTTPGATNFLLDDLSACNFTRTVQICGNDVLLDAGNNFDSYIWAKDENGNQQIDPADTILNDGDPDNDPSTMMVNDIGTYIVDKIVADPCKSFSEIIIVERFGTAQNNPIIDYFNAVNSDADPTNDIQGEIVSCSIDNDLLPKIFLCGINDTQLLQINIVDAQSLVWEQLNEASCAPSGDDCANKNLSCSWNQVGTGNNYNLTSAGKYRLVVNYQNGCFSRFYLNVFQNTLDIQYSKNDIICTTPGNITITNLGNGYGYRLIDIATNSIVVPFSANNGPSFNINTNGAYRVDIVQLDNTGVPIPGACIFSTPDIGILNRNFQVAIATTSANCNTLGSINIQVANVNPNYEYELRLDDGSNGGSGTLLDNETAQPDNNFTFNNLNPDNYIVITRTDDGCEDIQNITVTQVPDLTLSALTTANIGCEDGTITLTANGGFPNPDYNYAIWSKNGSPLYATVNDIPGSAYQVGNIFSFIAGEEGDYQFVVVDANNCSAISNTVTIIIAPDIEYTTSATDEVCFGASDGSFSVNVTNSNGYSASYTLTYPDTTTATNTSGTFTGLPQGNYTLTLTQTQGAVSCDYIETFTIGGPISGVTGIATLIQDYTCVQNGIIEAQNVIGGTAPYEYSIDGVNFVSGPGAETFSNLTNGTYTITVRDANSCTFATNPITIDPLNPPSDLTFTSTAPNCPAQTSDVVVTVVDGTTPFIFEIIAPMAISASSISGNTADFDGLAPNTYTYRVTDSKGCTYEESYTINPVNPIAVNGTLISNVSCVGSANGTIDFSISGFTATYLYTINGGSPVTGQSATTINLTGLIAGAYTIVVTDETTNCTDTETITVNEPSVALALTQVFTPLTCTADASVTITATDGWGAYSYEIEQPDTTVLGPQPGNVFAGLTQTGTYTISVTDAGGCTINDTFTLNAAIAPVLEIIPNAICYDNTNGLILTANVISGGDGNFEYSHNGGIFGSNNVFSGLAPGTHTINVRDGKNCTDTANITINPELSVIASAGNITSCSTTTDITITAAGGDGNYVYAVVADGVAPTPGDFGVVNPITVTGAGDYDVYVRDNNGTIIFCEASYDITIVQDAPIVITPTATPVVCFGDANGAINLVVSGGAAPYEYSIDNGANYQTTGNFVNLAAGTYPIRVRDANNCEQTESIDVTEPAQLVAEAVQTQAHTCLQLGEITVGSVTPTSGGSGDYQYSLNGGTWTPSTTGGTVFAGLMDGTYSISVRDANAVSCVITLADIIIAPLPVEPTLSTTVVYNCDGSGNITVLPNDPSYTYSIDAGAPQASNVFNNIAVGNHAITVDYGSGCTVDTTVAVDPGNAFNATITNFTNLLCNGNASGTITFEIENFDAVNGFEYSINAGAFSAPQTSSPITINGLSAGLVTIVVRDVLDNTCSITLDETLTEPTLIVANAGITGQFTCNNTGATITASATGGTPTYEYQLEDNVGGIITAYQSGTVFTAVPVGDYIVRVRDINSCTDPIDIAITVAAPNDPTFTATPIACYSGANDGTIQVDVTSIPGNGNFQFSINAGPWITPTPATATTYTFTNLAAGTYTIDVKDGFGCPAVQQNITINPQLTANAVLTSDLTCLAPATVTINATGGSGTYSYEWSSDAGANYFTTNFTGNVFGTNTAGTYIFRVTDTTAPAACTLVTNQIIVSPADTPIITTVTPTHILCNGDSTGALDVIIDTSVGSPPYVIEVIETISTTNYGTQTTGLPAGDYEVTITDDKGCVSAPFAVTINQPDAIVYSINLVPIICNPVSGTDPGSITVENLTGGTAEYTYYLTGNNGFSASYVTTTGGEDHTFAILEFGIYEVDVVDANGCSVRTTNIIASPPNDLDIDVSTATVSCAAGGTAIVTVSSAVGSGNYEFAILETYTVPYSTSYQAPDVPGGDTATFTGLVPGITYTFVVHDLTTNCYYFETAALPIDSPSNMTVTSLVESNVSCTGANDGNVTFIFDTFDVLATDVNYEIFNSQSNVTTGFTGTTAVNPPAGPVTISNFATLPPGIYYILLAEVGGPFDGCSIGSPNFTIDESTNLLSVTAASPTNDNCNLNAGVITATAQFGTAPYEFQYLLSTDPPPTAASPGWTSSTTANVESGDYIVYVKDAYDCIQNDAVTVALDVPPEISLAIIDECASEGTFEVLVTLGIPGISPYQLSINGGPFQNITFNGSSQYTVTGLSSGLGQTIAVRDLNGCADTDSFSLVTPLEFIVLQTVLLDCELGAAANAEITIEVTSGSGNYDYSVDGPGAIDQVRTALPSNPFTWAGASGAGIYAVVIYDNNTIPPNCSETVLIDVPTALLPVFTETHTNVSCNGADDGTITLTDIDTGLNPIAYTLTPMPGGVILNGKTFENVPAGTYDVRGTGTNSCFTDIFSIVITEPAAIVVPAPAVVEFGCTVGNNPDNATITVDDTAITGGSTTYVIYEFINDQGTPGTGDDFVAQTGSNTVYTETNVVGGSYIINVYDNNGCIGSSTAIILPYDELLTATAAITNPISCSPGTDGEITITVTSTNNNTTRFEYSIDNGANYQVSNVFTGLGIGVHDFLIRHVDTGCIITVSETITDPNTFDIVVNKLQDVICFGTSTGEVEFSITDATYIAGFDYQVFEQITNTSMTAVLNQANLGPTPVVNLPVGDYYVVITQDNHPFCTQQENFSIAGPPAAITANTDITPITCLGNDGIIEIIDVLGGWGGYSYYLGTVAPTGSGDYVAGPQFAPLTPGTYQAWVIDSAGCQQLIQNGIVLGDPAPITATLQINQENCTNLQGEIEVVGTTGGQGSNYTYQLIKDGSNFGASQTTTIFSGLGAGSYEVRITDQWSCNVTIGPEVLYEEMNLTSTVIKPIDCTVSPSGEITITANGGSTNLDYTVTFPDLATTISNGSGIFVGLSQPGTYTFVVRDLDTTPNCIEQIAVILNAPTPVVFTYNQENVSCNGGSDGSIEIILNASNDNPLYTYTLDDGTNPPTVQNSTLFTGLVQGSYDITVTSGRACSDTQTIVITEPVALNLTATATAFVCNPDNSVAQAVITAIGSNGTAPYTYSIDGTNFFASNTFDITDTGAVQNITVTIMDDNGCTDTALVSINPLPTITAVSATQVTAITCANDETVRIAVTGGSGDFDFDLLPLGTIATVSPGAAVFTTDFNLAAPGDYTFRVTDNTTGCFFITTPYAVAPYDLIGVTAVAVTPVTCFGDTNGELQINISGYSGPYDYEVFTQTGASMLTGSGNTTTNPFIIPGLSGGNYYVRVTETNAPTCAEDSNIITIISPDMALIATINPLANVTCTNDQGEILVNPTGGYAPYDILLTNTTTAEVYNVTNVTSHVFTGLSAGNFDIAITDNGGCILNNTETLVAPTPITANITATPTTLTCYGDTNAIVTAINILNGSGTYQYQLNYYDPTGTVIDLTTGGQISPIFDNLGSGIYSITVSDGWNCDVETIQVTISDPIEVFASLIRTSPLTCAMQAGLELTANGGTGPYFYSEDGTNFFPMTGGNTHTFTVSAGSYRYYVQDSFNCTSILSNEVTEDTIEPLTLNIDKIAAFINCNGDNTAIIYADADGGLGNYQYELFTDASLSLGSRIAGPQSLGEFPGLVAGTYYVNVTSEDCTATPEEVIISEPVPLTYTDTIVNISCFGEDNGSITVALSGGSGGYQYAISPNLNKFDTVNTFTDLASGNYTVIAQDQNGCFEQLEYIISEPTVINVAPSATPEICAGNEDGTITLVITGGTAPYRTSINSNTDADFIIDRTNFSNLAGGNYLIFVKDAQDCETNLTVTVESGVNLNASVEPVYECTGNSPTNYVNITLEDPSVLGDVLYALNSMDPAVMQLNPDFRDIAPGSHYIAIAHLNGCVETFDFEIEAFEPLTLTLEQNNLNEITAVANGGRQDYTFYFDSDDNGTNNIYRIRRTDTYEVRVVDENGCEATASIFMEFIDIEVPNFFTPDGDNLNDYWVPKNQEGFPEILTVIFDRYGRDVYRMGINDPGWSGIYNGTELPSGDYWYVIKLRGEDDDREFVGHFTLYR